MFAVLILNQHLRLVPNIFMAINVCDLFALMEIAGIYGAQTFPDLLYYYYIIYCLLNIGSITFHLVSLS